MLNNMAIFANSVILFAYAKHTTAAVAHLIMECSAIARNFGKTCSLCVRAPLMWLCSVERNYVAKLADQCDKNAPIEINATVLRPDFQATVSDCTASRI